MNASARLEITVLAASFALGVLMNTRGLVELVILNAALDLGVLSPTLFTLMVLMALITTFMTTPILSAMRIGTAIERIPISSSSSRMAYPCLPTNSISFMMLVVVVRV